MTYFLASRPLVFGNPKKIVQERGCLEWLVDFFCAAGLRTYPRCQDKLVFASLCVCCQIGTSCLLVILPLPLLVGRHVHPLGDCVRCFLWSVYCVWGYVAVLVIVSFFTPISSRVEWALCTFWLSLKPHQKIHKIKINNIIHFSSSHRNNS